MRYLSDFLGRLVHCVTALWEQLSPLFQAGLFPPEQLLGIAGQINKDKIFPAQVYGVLSGHMINYLFLLTAGHHGAVLRAHVFRCGFNRQR